MSLEIHAPKVDALARELASATGEDIDTAVVRAIEERLARPPRRRVKARNSSRSAAGWFFDTLKREVSPQKKSRLKRGFSCLESRPAFGQLFASAPPFLALVLCICYLFMQRSC